MYNIPQDSIEVVLMAEEFVTTETVKVPVTITMVSKDKANARDQMMKALKSIIDSEWRFTQLDRGEDDTGLEKITAQAVTRVLEKDTANLHSRAKDASIAGMKLSIGAIDYSPTQAQMEECTRKLRAKLYEMAQKEANTLNENTHGEIGKWRVSAMNFSSNDPHKNLLSNSRNVASKAMSYSSAGVGAALGSASSEESDEGVDLTRKLIVTAAVTLNRLAWTPNK